jgi:putative membrane protein
MHVKDLGKLMADDHTTSQRGLVTLAQSKGISIPTQPTNRAKDAHTSLNSKSGKDFDLFYSDLMVKEHEYAIDKFEKAVIECTDSDIKNWATSELSLLRNHLLHAVECKNKCLQNQ